MKKKRRWLYVLGGLLVVLGIGFLVGSRGLKETVGLTISDVDLSEVADGSYRGEYAAGRFKTSVEVNVQNHKIVGVVPLGLDNSKAIDRGVLDIYSGAVTQIIEKQTLEIDVVSGATATTKSLTKAVENALRSAGGK